MDATNFPVVTISQVTTKAFASIGKAQLSAVVSMAIEADLAMRQENNGFEWKHYNLALVQETHFAEKTVANMATVAKKIIIKHGAVIRDVQHLTEASAKKVSSFIAEEMTKASYQKAALDTIKAYLVGAPEKSRTVATPASTTTSTPAPVPAPDVALSEFDAVMGMLANSDFTADEWQVIATHALLRRDTANTEAVEVDVLAA